MLFLVSALGTPSVASFVNVPGLASPPAAAESAATRPPAEGFSAAAAPAEAPATTAAEGFAAAAFKSPAAASESPAPRPRQKCRRRRRPPQHRREASPVDRACSRQLPPPLNALSLRLGIRSNAIFPTCVCSGTS